jgi:hypothetical protein
MAVTMFSFESQESNMYLTSMEHNESWTIKFCYSHTQLSVCQNYQCRMFIVNTMNHTISTTIAIQHLKFTKNASNVAKASTSNESYFNHMKLIPLNLLVSVNTCVKLHLVQ